MMKILAWNCRGAHRNEFEDIARDLLFRHDPCIFIVMDTRVASEKATEIINNLSSLNDKITVSALNHVGGMWVLWNSNQITLSRVQVSNSCIRAIASFNNNTLLALQVCIWNWNWNWNWWNYPKSQKQAQFRMGLKIVCDVEIKHLIIEFWLTFLIISCLQNRELQQQHNNLQTLFLDIMTTLAKFDTVIIEFGYRELNGASNVCLMMNVILFLSFLLRTAVFRFRWTYEICFQSWLRRPLSNL